MVFRVHCDPLQQGVILCSAGGVITVISNSEFVITKCLRSFIISNRKEARGTILLTFTQAPPKNSQIDVELPQYHSGMFVMSI